MSNTYDISDVCAFRFFALTGRIVSYVEPVALYGESFWCYEYSTVKKKNSSHEMYEISFILSCRCLVCIIKKLTITMPGRYGDVVSQSDKILAKNAQLPHSFVN